MSDEDSFYLKQVQNSELRDFLMCNQARMYKVMTSVVWKTPKAKYVLNLKVTLKLHPEPKIIVCFAFYTNFPAHVSDINQPGNKI